MFFVNKNVNHGGTIYQNGAEIKIGDHGFRDLLKAGHINEGRGTVAIAPVDEPEIESEEAEEVEELPKQKRKR
jgi:hypothetical protein